jgi:2'-5' RNA ligase
VPENLKKKIKEFQQKMKNLPMKAKFVETSNLHFTVTFLGETGSEALSNIKMKMNGIVKNMNKFNVKINELKVIPNENYIRVIGIKVKDSEKIANLIKEVAEKIGGKYYLEQKITLCRVKQIFEKNQIKKFIEMNKDVEIGEFQVNAVSLVQSKLTRSGPVYESIHYSYLK